MKAPPKTNPDGDAMKNLLNLDRSLVFTGLPVLGMVMAILGWWPLSGDAARLSSGLGLTLVYLSGGLPAGLRAGCALWR